jgi:hypothetical protein
LRANFKQASSVGADTVVDGQTGMTSKKKKKKGTFLYVARRPKNERI